MRNTRCYGGNQAYDDESNAKPGGALMHMDRFWRGRLLSQGPEEPNGAKTKRRHGQRGSNPGKGSAIERKLSAEPRHARAVLR